MQLVQKPLQTAWWLVRCELYKFNKELVQTIIDAVIPPITAVMIAHIMTYLGLAKSWGGLMIIGELVFFCIGVPMWRFGQKLIMSWETDESLTFELTLPVPYWMVLGRIVVAWTIQNMVINVPALFIAKALLGNRFDWSHISWAKFIVLYVIMNIGFCMMAALVTFAILSMEKIWRFWDRVIFPISLLSIDFGWSAAYAALKPLAFAMLFVPFTYAYEGLRAAVLGQEGFLNYWICLNVLVLSSCIFAALGKYYFKKNLDCV